MGGGGAKGVIAEVLVAEKWWQSMAVVAADSCLLFCFSWHKGEGGEERFSSFFLGLVNDIQGS